MPQPAVRDLRDPRTLRAMAHPLRLRILDTVACSGPVTATQVAEQVGESPANCSWHLRQLARYGFVEEAGGGTGRQRPWRLVRERQPRVSGDPDPTHAGRAAHQVLLDVEYRALREWLDSRHQESPQWRDAGFLTQSVGWCTPAQLAEIGAAITELLARRLPVPADPRARPHDARPVRFIAWGVPARPPEPATADDG